MRTGMVGGGAAESVKSVTRRVRRHTGPHRPELGFASGHVRRTDAFLLAVEYFPAASSPRGSPFHREWESEFSDTAWENS